MRPLFTHPSRVFACLLFAAVSLLPGSATARESQHTARMSASPGVHMELAAAHGAKKQPRGAKQHRRGRRGRVKYAAGRAPSPLFKEVHSGAAYPFLLYVPKDAPAGPLPVLLFLHGRSLSGTNLNAVRHYGVLDAIERGRRIPAIVAAPQVSRRSSWEPDKVLSVLEYVQQHYATDTARVYVTGMSLGGYGTLHFTGKYPEKVAAAAALCGGGKPADAGRLATTNLWIMHGKRDRAVSFHESESIYHAIKACNPRAECTLTLFPSYNHSDLAREFFTDTLYAWMFRFSRGHRGTDAPRSTDTLRTLLPPVLAASTLPLHPGTPELRLRGLPATDDAPSSHEVSSTDDPSTPDDAPITRQAHTARTGRAARTVHVVRQGDTLGSIARRYNTSVAALVRSNGIKDNTILKIGQKISVR